MNDDLLRYSVHPDFVQSNRDGQTHYIEAHRLMFLYGVRESECLVIDDSRDRHTYARLMRKAEELGLVSLRPRYDGNYTLPEKA